MTKPPTKQQRDELLDLTKAKNRALSALSFKHIKTYEDFIVSLGHDRDTLSAYYFNPSALKANVTREDIIAFFGSYETELKQKHAGVYDNFRYEFVPHEYEGVYYDGTNSVGIPANIVESSNVVAGDTLTLEETLPESALQKCQLFPFQERAAKALLDGITKGDKRGQLLRAAVGTGKTFIIGALIRRLLDLQFTQDKTYSPWPIVYVTKATIVEQTKRVLERCFGVDTVNEVQVINIEQLRASFGELFLEWKTVVKHGEEVTKWVWRPGVNPCILLLDECQQVKNKDSQQSQILQAFNDITLGPTYQVHFSATPFLRVCEAKCFCVSTRIKTKYGITEGVPLSNESWPDFEAHVAHPAEPEEYNQAAVKRLMDKMSNYIVDVKGVRPQFNARNTVQLIEFETPEERLIYEQAWARYERARKKIEGYELSGSQSRFLILAQFTVFRKAAELCRVKHLAKVMYESVQNGQAACCATNFKGTITGIVKELVDNYGVSRDDISLVWGGGQTKKTTKQKAKEVMNSDLFKDIFADVGLTEADLNLEDVEEYTELAPELVTRLRLGNQNKKQRQQEIDRFQSGKSKYCLFTFKAGGVGLSLHHTDEMTKEKVRRTRNNWAVKEDIAKIPTRQRVCFLAPTFSAIELVQGLGRCPRLTSLSDTPQVIIFYRGTIEERVAAIVNQKLRCLKEVVRTREDWQDVCNETKHNDTTVLVENKASAVMTEEEIAENSAALFGDSVDEEESDMEIIDA